MTKFNDDSDEQFLKQQLIAEAEVEFMKVAAAIEHGMPASQAMRLLIPFCNRWSCMVDLDWFNAVLADWLGEDGRP